MQNLGTKKELCSCDPWSQGTHSRSCVMLWKSWWTSTGHFSNLTGSCSFSKLDITLFYCMVVFRCIFSIWYGPPLSYLHGRNLRKRKKLTPLQIMHDASMNSKNIVNRVDIFLMIVLLWTLFLENNTMMNNESKEYFCDEQWFLMHNAKSLTPPKFPSSTWMY